MKPLVMRDFRAYRTFLLIQIVLMLLYSYLNIRFGSVDGIVGFLVIFLPAIAGIILFIGDNELIPYMASLPVSRKHLVIGKYLSTYLFGLVMISVTIFITWILSGYYPDARTDFEQLISIRGFMFAIMPISLIVIISYPFLFRFGLRLGVKILLASFALAYAGGTILGEKYLKTILVIDRRGIFVTMMALFEKAEEKFGLTTFYLCFGVMLIVLLVCSVKLSIHWMQMKDLD